VGSTISNKSKILGVTSGGVFSGRGLSLITVFLKLDTNDFIESVLSSGILVSQ